MGRIWYLSLKTYPLGVKKSLCLGHRKLSSADQYQIFNTNLTI